MRMESLLWSIWRSKVVRVQRDFNLTVLYFAPEDKSTEFIKYIVI